MLGSGVSGGDGGGGDSEIHATQTTAANITAGGWKLHKWKWPLYTLLLSGRLIHLEKTQVLGDL